MLTHSPQPAHTGEQGGDALRAEAPASNNSATAPSPAVAIVKCSDCKRFKHGPTDWRTQSPSLAVVYTISHGLCPDCCDKQRTALFQAPPHNITAAGVLRGMIQGNLDQAKRLIACGQPGMALRELEDAMHKIDLFFKSLA